MTMNPPVIRTGIGYDIHPLASGRPLIIGGVEIPFDRGLAGHSDADVLCHAVADAILGAAGLGDIGMHFPDTDSRYRGMSSLLLLEQVREKVGGAGFRILHLDTIIIAERPKMDPYKTEIRARLANALGVEEAAVNIKAKTSGGLGALGRSEGIAAQAVCTLAHG